MNGFETCTRCRSYILIVHRKVAARRGGMCVCCYGLVSDGGDVDHDSMLRCPKCTETWSVSGCDDGELYGEDVHAVSCPECCHDFEIVTHVSHSFTSPAVLS